MVTLLMNALDELHSCITDLGDEAIVPDVAAGLSIAKLAVLDERASYAGKGRSINRDKAAQRTVEALDRIEGRLERELESAITYCGTEFGYQSGISAAIRCVLDVREEMYRQTVEMDAA